MAGSLIFRTVLTLGLMVFLLAACKTNSTVGMRMILPPGAEIMEIPENQSFLMASPVSQPMPVFPAAAPRNTNTSVCLELIINESGSVSSATPSYALPECLQTETGLDQRFVTSAVAAAKEWQFLAAATCAFPVGTPKTDDCSGDRVVITPVAIKVSYVFSFQGDGRVSVKVKRA